MRPLTLEDISDARAYEHEREEFRSSVIALKRLRRVAVGPLVTVVFENRTTMRFQIQEMARAEKMVTDEQIAGELAAYNPLIPGVGEISMTLFIELQTEADLRKWLPKLVGIERAVLLEIGPSPGDESAGTADHAIETVRAVVDRDHDALLTREEVTAAVHYVRLALSPDEQQRLAVEPARLAIRHPHYNYDAELSPGTTASLLADWRTDGAG